MCEMFEVMTGERMTLVCQYSSIVRMELEFN